MQYRNQHFFIHFLKKIKGHFLPRILNLGASFKGRVGDFVEASNSKLALKA